MSDLVAKKRLTYATRRLMPGDAFKARSRLHARLLVAAGKADHADVPATVPTPTPDETGVLRATYEARFGKRPFMGWNAETLKAKLADG